MTLEVRVAAARELGGGVRELTLRRLGGGPLPPFSPGSHVVVHIILGERRRLNPYSLACEPGRDDAYRIAVRRVADGRGGSAFLHDEVAVGDVLAIEPPRNLFAPAATARRHLLVAGGVGITPFVAYVHRLARDGAPFELHHSGRDGTCAPLLDELRALARGAVHAHANRIELLAGLAHALRRQPLGTHLSLCGPAPMMDAVGALAAAQGWPTSRVHVERFAVAEGPMEPFDAQLGRGGPLVRVGADETLLEALERAGLDVPYLCRQGVCGECRTGVLGGVPDHRDVFLTAEEGATGTSITPCVSRCASGPLVLDLTQEAMP